MKFGTGIDFVNILGEFEGQGHRSKVKVIELKNVIFIEFLLGFSVMNGIMISYVHKICVRAQRFGTQEVQQHFSVFFLKKPAY